MKKEIFNHVLVIDWYKKIKNKKMGKIEIFKDVDNLFRFRVIAENGEIVATSESYTQKHNCQKGIEALREDVNSQIIDLTK